jgi:hypothetical protein
MKQIWFGKSAWLFQIESWIYKKKEHQIGISAIGNLNEISLQDQKKPSPTLLKYVFADEMEIPSSVAILNLIEQNHVL